MEKPWIIGLKIAIPAFIFFIVAYYLILLPFDIEVSGILFLLMAICLPFATKIIQKWRKKETNIQQQFFSVLFFILIYIFYVVIFAFFLVVILGFHG